MDEKEIKLIKFSEAFILSKVFLMILLFFGGFSNTLRNDNDERVMTKFFALLYFR